MPKRVKLICLDCSTIFNRKPGRQQQSCHQCSSVRVERVTGGKPGLGAPVQVTTISTAPTIVTPPTPTVSTPPVSTIPQAPPMGGLSLGTPRPSTGGGAITPELLIAQRNRLRAIPKRTPKPLPGPKTSTTPVGIRTLANNVVNTVVNGVCLGMSYRPRGTTDELQVRMPAKSHSLAFVLTKIAQGAMNTHHSNFNTSYRNHGLELPSRTGPQSVVGRGIAYREYGWTTPVPSTARWNLLRGGVIVGLDRSTESAVNGLVQRAFKGSINTERLVIAETGELFYTPDHYFTFFRYHPATDAWYQYCSEERYSGRGPHWDESFYA